MIILNHIFISKIKKGELISMNILIALLPAIGWGCMPLITGKVGGSPVNQMFGIGAGASIIGLIAYFITGQNTTPAAFWFSFVCGALWCIGQIGQFISFKRIGVSNTIPLSTCFQLVGSSVLGVLLLGQWATPKAKLIGFGALILVVIGSLLTSKKDQASDGKMSAKDILFLLCTTAGYWVYSLFPNMPAVAGQPSEAIFLPETLGILFGSVLYCIFSGNIKAFKQKEQYLNILGGLSWGIAALAYVFSAKDNGVNMAFIFSQLNVIIGTFGGIWILKEHKTKKEMTFTIAGILLMIAGAILTVFAK